TGLSTRSRVITVSLPNFRSPRTAGPQPRDVLRLALRFGSLRTEADGAREQASEGVVQLDQDGALDTHGDRLHRLAGAHTVDDQRARELLGALVGRREPAQREDFPRLRHWARILPRLVRAEASRHDPARG